MTKKMIFRAILFIAVTILCFSLLHSETIAKAPANFGEHDAGTPSNPYRISGLDNLRWLSEHPEDWFRGPWEAQVYFIQTTDIDATETLIWNYGKGFRPIGYFHHLPDAIFFCGVYDGGGYTISNLSIYIDERPSYEYMFSIGLFSDVGQSTLKNINLIDINYTINTELNWLIRIGGLAGSILNSDIQNVHVTGNINTISPSVSPDVGGLVGMAGNSYFFYSSFVGEINTTSNTSITNAYLNIGGIVGFGFTEIYECFSKGKINATSTAGTVRGGGIAGQIFPAGIIYNCYSMMDIYTIALSGTSYAGGIAGFNSPAYILIANCYFTGLIEADIVGGIAGFILSRESSGDIITVFNNFWDIETTDILVAVGENAGGIITDCFGLTTIQMKQADTYIEYGWHFEIIWEIDAKINEGYPFLKNNIYHIMIPYPVTLLTPENEAVEVDLRPVFRWDLPTESGEIEGLRFYIEPVENSFICYENRFDLTEYILSQHDQASERINGFHTYTERINAFPTILPADTTEYTLEIDLDYETTYYWSVVAFNEFGDSVDNQVFTFTTIEFSSNKDENALPLVTELLGNFPNPFNPETNIRFNLSVELIVSIDIYNIRGQRVKRLLDGFYERGSHTVVWDGKDDNSRELGSGVYFYRMVAGDVVETRRMVLLK